ncbi:7850_t:CDS:2, partial [Gigaspora rosea]
GEDVVINNNGPELRCSADFSAIDVNNFRQYLITSARCLPDSQNPNEQPEAVERDLMTVFDDLTTTRASLVWKQLSLKWS